MVGNKGTKKDTRLVKGNHAKPIQSLAIARRGIATSGQLASLHVAVICDLLEDRIATPVANALSGQSARLLKAKEMEFRYGRASKENGNKQFLLTDGVTA